MAAASYANLRADGPIEITSGGDGSLLFKQGDKSWIFTPEQPYLTESPPAMESHLPPTDWEKEPRSPRLTTIEEDFQSLGLFIPPVNRDPRTAYPTGVVTDESPPVRYGRQGNEIQALSRHDREILLAFAHFGRSPGFDNDFDCCASRRFNTT